MTTEQQVQFENAQTGNDLLNVLDSMIQEQTDTESPTLVPMEF
jgi:hypothetical protein